MPEYVVKLRCPTCKHEEEVVIEAPDAEKAKIEGVMENAARARLQSKWKLFSYRESQGK